MSKWPSPDFKQAKALDEAARQLESKRNPDPAELEFLFEQGWSPFLSYYLTKISGDSNPSYQRHFQSDSQWGRLFETLVKAHPVVLESLAICDASAQNPWRHLGSHQRSFLVSTLGELLAAPVRADFAKGTLDGWLASISLALLPVGLARPHASEVHPEKPFFGYFESQAWVSLKSERPQWAGVLAGTLCALTSLEDDTKHWAALAAGKALECERPAVVPQNGFYEKVLGEAAAASLAKDDAETLRWFVSIRKTSPLEAEKAAFASWTPSPLRLSDFLARDSHSVREIKRRIEAKKPFAMGFLDEKTIGRLHSSLMMPFESVPFFALAAAVEAEHCWHALVDEFGAPWDIEALATNQSRLPSPLEIDRRMARHMQAAISAGGDGVSRLERNLKNEKARAKRLLAKLPLPAELMEQLAGSQALSQWGAEARSMHARFDDKALMVFENACQKALKRSKEEKPTSIEMPVAITWVSMMVRAGIKPSFLQKIAPVGMLAKGCSFYDHAFVWGARESLSDSECSAIERDDLALSLIEARQGAEIALPQQKRARL